MLAKRDVSSYNALRTPLPISNRHANNLLPAVIYKNPAPTFDAGFTLGYDQLAAGNVARVAGQGIRPVAVLGGVVGPSPRWLGPADRARVIEVA